MQNNVTNSTIVGGTGICFVPTPLELANRHLSASGDD